MNTKNRKKKNKSGVSSRLNKKKIKRETYRTIVSPGRQLSEPDSIEVDLIFESEVTVYNSAGAQFYAYYYRINAPFDPDPVGSSKLAGMFAEWSLIYNRYRVVAATVTCVAVNAETFPVAIYFAPATTTLTIASKTDVVDLGEVPFACKTLMLANTTGMNSGSRTMKLNFSQFVGNRQSVWSDDVYSSAVTTTPTKIIYFYIGLYTNSNMSNGVQMSVRINFRTLFTERYQQVPNSLHLERTPQYKAMMNARRDKSE